MILLVEGAADARLRELVRALSLRHPGIEVHTSAVEVLNAPAGSLLVLAARESELGVLNMERPVFARRGLRVILWNRPGLSAAMVQRAPDFFDWISDLAECPPAVPAFAVAGFRAALVARAPGVVWTSGPLDEVFRSAFPGRVLRHAALADGATALVEAVRAAGRDWIAITGAGTPSRVRSVEAALAEAGRRSRVVLVDAGRFPMGWWPLHGVTMGLDSACRRLARARSPGRLAALADLEPEVVDLIRDLLDRGVAEEELTRVLLDTADPGAALGRLAVTRGLVGRDDVLRGAVVSPPLLRAFAAEIHRAGRARVPLREENVLPEASGTEEDGGDATHRVVDASGSWRVEYLLEESRRLYREARYAEALRAADQAVLGAEALRDLGLEIGAKLEQALGLHMLGDDAAALARYDWILGMAADPAHRDEIEGAGVQWEIADAYGSWVDTAGYLPEVPAQRRLAVLDEGESYVRTIGRPGWRAGLLNYRARVLADLGRLEEAIGVAEEGLSLELRDGDGPGPPLTTHRWALGGLLRESGRYDDARAHYRAVVDDAAAHSIDRMAALEGLARCALAADEAADARRLAEDSVRLAEGMGDDCLAPVLEVLTDACLAAGDVEAARSAADRRLAGVRRHGSTSRLYFALLSAAVVAIAQHDAPGARALLDEAQPHAEAIDRSNGRTNLGAEVKRLRARLAKLDPT